MGRNARRLRRQRQKRKLLGRRQRLRRQRAESSWPAAMSLPRPAHECSTMMMLYYGRRESRTGSVVWRQSHMAGAHIMAAHKVPSIYPIRGRDDKGCASAAMHVWSHRFMCTDQTGKKVTMVVVVLVVQRHMQTSTAQDACRSAAHTSHTL